MAVLTHPGVAALNIIEQVAPLLHISIDVRKIATIFG